MKILLLVISISAFVLSCNGTNRTKQRETAIDSVSTVRQASPITDTNTNIVKNTIKAQPKSDLANKILGIWASVGMENASFVIEKKKISYPETFTSYKYSLFKDSLKIKYDDYTGSYLIRMKGADTLVLSGDEEQIYYRFKG